MPVTKRIDRRILSLTEVGEWYTVSYLSGRLDKGKQEVTGSMSRLTGKGFFTVTRGDTFVYLRVRDGDSQ